VTLKFGGIPKYLKVPYHAITRFHDPSVGFALQFDAPEEIDPAANSVDQLRSISKTSDDKDVTAATIKKSKKSKGKSKAASDESKAAPDDTDKPDGPDDDGGGPKVVSLDAFRKK